MDIGGTVAPGFEPVRDEFERNFAERGEVGAACCVYRGAEPVVDLWGGGVVAAPEDESFTVFVGVQLTVDADFEALDRILASFVVTPQ